MGEPDQQQLRVVAPRFDITETTAGLEWQNGSIERLHEELKADYLAGSGPGWEPPSRKEWAETCAHMEWLGSVIEAQRSEANEARRHLALSESWVKVRDQVRDLTAMGSDDETLVAAREVTSRAATAADEIRRVADMEDVPSRAASRLRWIANRLAPNGPYVSEDDGGSR